MPELPEVETVARDLQRWVAGATIAGVAVHWERTIAHPQPAERFAVELDTYDYHGNPTSFESDRLRQEDLKLAGIEMTRVTGVRMSREPTAVITRIRRLLAQRRDQLRLPHRPAD